MDLVICVTLFLNYKLDRGGAKMNIVPGKDCAISYFLLIHLAKSLFQSFVGHSNVNLEL